MQKYFQTCLLMIVLALPTLANGLPRSGDPAPDFTLNTMSGKPFTLSTALRDGYVMLIFFETQCVYCYSHIGNLNDLHDKYHGKGLNILAINFIGESEFSVREYARDNGLKYGVAVDKLTGIDVAEAYKVLGSPTIVLIAPDSKIAFYGYTIPDVSKWVK